MMKTILVPTDFSKGATHAAEIAIRLAEQLHDRLLLWNCAPQIPVMPGYLGGPLLAETVAGSVESQDKFQQVTEDLEDFMTNTGGDYKPQLLTRYSEGGFREALARQLREEAFELIVIGAPAGCAIEHIFTGSHTLQVIEAAVCPVLIVPSRAALSQLEKVVFATDYEPGDLEAISYLSELSQTLGFRIEVVHVIVNGENRGDAAQKETIFNEQLAKLKGPPISSKEIRGRDVVGRLNRVSKQTGADMLTMSHHHYSFFKNLFSESKVERELAHQKIPLLVFPLKNSQKQRK
ncbi:universal stress protein [Mucilaginibacter sp. UR6-11]|uniref:universal stress protein n=1 Tax=Mucilaginibacter sp. UR6-11 TaxID=1435644 RepID=UPI001E518A0E|nr:universal stress protein [Mucilaginibacter sp. UR6-11]MCC8426619.1 universal stress protein [Mucilaginibacter sp. UR6-11]